MKDHIKDKVLAEYMLRSELRRPERSIGYLELIRWCDACRVCYRQGDTPSKAISGVGMPREQLARELASEVARYYWDIIKRERGNGKTQVS